MNLFAGGSYGVSNFTGRTFLTVGGVVGLELVKLKYMVLSLSGALNVSFSGNESATGSIGELSLALLF